MKNSLKPETTPVISVLKNANIRTVMVTGKEVWSGEERCVVMSVQRLHAIGYILCSSKLCSFVK